METRSGTPSSFGEYFKELRIKKGMTLRAFCATYGLDAGNISKLERGVANPPENLDILKRYASFLGVKEGSKEWHTLVDLASTETGRIPPDLMKSTDMVSRLPVLFRTIRRKKLSDADLEKLIDKLKDI